MSAADELATSAANKAAGKTWVVLYEGLGKIPIHCRHVLVVKDVDQGLASIRTQSVRGRPKVGRCLARCRLTQARGGGARHRDHRGATPRPQ
jgi:hypothetical protein